MFDKFLKVILLLSVTLYGVGMMPHRFEIMFFQLAAILLFCVSLFCKKVRTIGQRETTFCAVLMGGSFIGIFLNGFQSTSVMAYLVLFLCVLFGMTVYQYSKSSKSCFKWLAWGVAINVVMMLLQRYAGIRAFLPQNYDGLTYIREAGGMIGNAPRLCMLITLIIPFMPVSIACLFLIICCFLKEYVALVVCSTFLFIFFNKKQRVIVGVGAILLIWILTHMGKFPWSYIYTALSLRWELWKPAILAILKRPQGYGLGLYPCLSSSFLQITHMWGFAGIGLFVYIFRDFFRSFKADRETLGVVSLLMLMTVEYPLETIRFWPVIISMIAFYLIRKRRENHVDAIC